MLPDASKIDNNHKNIDNKSTKSTRYMLQKSRGVFFLRSPKRCRQLGHRRTGLGDLKPVRKINF